MYGRRSDPEDIKNLVVDKDYEGDEPRQLVLDFDLTIGGAAQIQSPDTLGVGSGTLQEAQRKRAAFPKAKRIPSCLFAI